MTLTVAAADIHAPLGPNGAGKTTLPRLLSGSVWPSSGQLGANVRRDAVLHPAAVVDELLQRNRRVEALTAPAQGRVPDLCRSDALSVARAPRAANWTICRCLPTKALTGIQGSCCAQWRLVGRADASTWRSPRFAPASSASISPSSANRHTWSNFGSQTSLPGSYLAPRGRSTLENVLFEKLGVERIGSAAREVAARPDCPCR